jgi:hypothetical protein
MEMIISIERIEALHEELRVGIRNALLLQNPVIADDSELVANELIKALNALNILASIPETKAILQELLFPEIVERLAKVEKELERMNGDGK